MTDNKKPPENTNNNGNVVGMRRVVKLQVVVTHPWYKILKAKGIIQADNLFDLITFVAIPQQVLERRIFWSFLLGAFNLAVLIALLIKLHSA